MAQFCKLKKLYHTAAGLYAAAFAADPKLADNLRAWHRYNAGCHAALAAAGQGQDAARLDDKERTRLRQQAVRVDFHHGYRGAASDSAVAGK